jgi:biotin synthase-like enzyme
MSSQPIIFHACTQTIAADTWPVDAVLALFDMPFSDLMLRAQQTHRQHFDPTEVELATLLSIKTGGCPEDCGYCPQAARYDTGVTAQKILPLDTVLQAARAAKAEGATRFCMGAAWREPKDRDLDHVEEMVREVKALGMETCVTLGMLAEHQAQRLKDAGLDYYNHNLVQVPGTPLYGQDPLDPLEFVRTIAVARITMPTARVRLSAGRRQLGDAVQAMCFMAGANSIFYGDKLLTTGNPEVDEDRALLARLGLKANNAHNDARCEVTQ